MAENSIALLLVLAIAPVIASAFAWFSIRLSKRLPYKSFLWLKFLYYVLGVLFILFPVGVFVGFSVFWILANIVTEKLPFDEKVITGCSAILGLFVYLLVGQKIGDNKPNAY